MYDQHVYILVCEYSLYLCLIENAASCVKLLLETTPSVMNWQDYEGRTPLHLAVEIGNDAVVLLLVIYKCRYSNL